MHPLTGGLATLAVVTALVGCGSSESNDGVTTTAAAGASSAEMCSNFGNNVEAYDILASGASRAEYLTLLHKLQRDCPDEAAARALTNEGAPQCQRLDQENCTMYLGP